MEYKLEQKYRKIVFILKRALTNHLVMSKNPFTSDTFISIWLKHFTNSLKPICFKGFHNISFVKANFLPVYLNVGRNWTKAMSYSIDYSLVKGGKMRAFLIYDVPEYMEVRPEPKNSPLHTIKVRQYQGYLANFKGIDSLSQYMERKFDSKSRYKFKRNKERLQKCFNTSETIYYGEISKQEYDSLMSSFKNLLIKAFKEKQVNSIIITKWEFYHDLIYPMILERKASLYVLKNEDESICISLNFHTEKTVILFFSVYDSDFSKFAIGYMSVMKCIEWCIENKMYAYDFSKGYFHYKKRWSSIEYPFYYHILYYPQNPISVALATVMASYFRLKQKLRENNIHKFYHRILFHLKSNERNTTNKKETSYGPETNLDPTISSKKLNLNTAEYSFLKRPLYDYLYKSGEHSKMVVLVEDQGAYWIVGTRRKQKIIL